MPSFGLISEGVTDRIVIKNILCGYFDNPDIEVTRLPEPLDETDKNNPVNYSNWQLVLQYCESTKFKEAFQFIDYLIVQIDTDVCDEPDFGIKKIEAGKELTPEELAEKVSLKLQGLIGQDFYEKFSKQIIFAIAVHSTECWLLPIFCKNHEKQKYKGCLKALDRCLEAQKVVKDEYLQPVKRADKKKTAKDSHTKTKKILQISSRKKEPDDYDFLSQEYRDNKTLMSKYEDNPSLKIFIEELAKREFTFED
jgi:hypothetical protein